MNIEKDMSMKNDMDIEKDMNLEKDLVIHGRGETLSYLRSTIKRASTKRPKLQTLGGEGTTHYFHVSHVYVALHPHWRSPGGTSITST
jgi:hypothetical protein